MRQLALFLVFGLSAAIAIVVASGSLLPPQSVGNGGLSTSRPNPQNISPISDRHFTSGNAQGQSTGAISFDFDLPVDKDKAYAQDDLAWIAFGGPGEPRAILVSLDEPEDSVAISQGSMTVLGTGGQCQFAISVTADLVEGDVDCVEADALRDGQRIGFATLHVHFTAGS